MLRRILPLAIPAILLLLSLSCSEKGTGPADDDPPGGLEIAYEAETDQAASVLITAADGGEVTATGSSGVSIGLSVPPGAVEADVTVTVTPLLDLCFKPKNWNNRPHSDCSQGGLFEPAGLTFSEPAILTLTYPASGLACLPDESWRIVAFDAASDFYELLATSWDDNTRALSCTVGHFSGYGTDNMSDRDFLEYLIRELSRHARDFPSESDLLKLLSYAQEALLRGWDDLVELARAGAEAVLDALVTSAVTEALADPGPSSRQLLIHYRDLAQAWGFAAIDARLAAALDQHVRVYAARGLALCSDGQHAAGRAILRAAIEWAMLGDIQAGGDDFIAQVGQWLDDCGDISVHLGADRGTAYTMVLDPGDRRLTCVTFTVLIAGVSGDNLAGKSVVILSDLANPGDLRPFRSGSTDAEGSFGAVQGASSVIYPGSCVVSKTVQYRAQVYHAGEWHHSGTISVTYRQLQIYNSIMYGYNFDGDTLSRSASISGAGTSPSGCRGEANCDALMDRSYKESWPHQTIDSIDDECRISACRAGFQYSIQEDETTGTTYLVITGIRVRDLDKVMHGLAVEACDEHQGCRTIGYSVGLCDPNIHPCPGNVIPWPSEALPQLIFPNSGTGVFDHFTWSYEGDYGRATLSIMVGCGYGD